MTRLESIVQDIRHAVRQLRKSPGFALVTIGTLALGVGANAAVFSVVNGVLLKPLPFHDPDRIVTISSSSPASLTGPGSVMSRQVAIPDFNDWHDQSTAFEAMAFYGGRQGRVSVGTTAEYARISPVSAEFFRVFDLEAAAGRLFSPEELQRGGSGAVVVSQTFARSHFADEIAALGQTIRLGANPRGGDRLVTIVGVLPSGFDFPSAIDVRFPAETPDDPTMTNRGAQNYLAIGRLRSSASLERAGAELSAIGARLERDYPQTNEGRRLTVLGLRNQMVTDVRLMLYLMLGAVALVLLVACLNLTSLLLARASTRAREIALRMALGASRGRIVRQLTIEGLLLAVLGAAAALALAVWGTRAIVALAPADVPRLADIAVDREVFAFTLALSVGSGVVLTLAPALQFLGVNLDRSLRHGTVRAAAGPRTHRTREALVVAQLAISMVLLIGGALLIKTFVALQHVPLGFQPAHVLVMNATVATSDPQQEASLFYQRLLREVSSVPGVLSAGATMSPPGRVSSTGGYWIDSKPKEQTPGTTPSAVLSIVTPGSFTALGIPLQRGRDFNDGDVPGAPMTAIVNQALVRQALAGQDALGHTIFCSFDSGAPMVIVGVVGDVRQAGPNVAPKPECYMPYRQHFYNGNTLSHLVRTADDPTALAATVRRKALELAPGVPVQFTTMKTLLGEHMAAPRFRAVLVGLFAAVTLCLAVTGVFGVIAFVVSQRANEIGVRLALGATPSSVLWLMLKRGLVLTAAGVAVGSAGALAATRAMSGVLFEVKASDPATYALVAVLLGGVALVAAYLPARRAAQIDPMHSLRSD